MFAYSTAISQQHYHSPGPRGGGSMSAVTARAAAPSATHAHYRRRAPARVAARPRARPTARRGVVVVVVVRGPIRLGPESRRRHPGLPQRLGRVRRHGSRARSHRVVHVRHRRPDHARHVVPDAPGRGLRADARRHRSHGSIDRRDERRRPRNEPTTRPLRRGTQRRRMARAAVDGRRAVRERQSLRRGAARQDAAHPRHAT